MNKITKCIIPAAGRGTRFLPASKAIAKEMFPIVDTPVIELLVKEAVEAGCNDIFIVTSKGKDEILDHFDSNKELESALKDNIKKKSLLDKSLSTAHGANIYNVRQAYPKGDGDALLKVKNLIGEDDFLVLFGDDLVLGEVGAASQLIDAYENNKSCNIATVTVGEKEVSSYGIIEGRGEKEFVVEKFLEKPHISATNSRNGVIGKYVLTSDIFNYLEQSSPLADDGETRLADALELKRQNEKIYGVTIKGERYDTGSKIGYLKANVAYGLKNEETKEELQEFLQSLHNVNYDSAKIR